MPVPTPINFISWIAQHQDELRPPVNNKCIQMGKDFFVMVIGGPNSRSDYHINETEEWFYQVKGGMVLKIVDPDDGQFKEISIGEGEMFLLPGGVPHNPCRAADTVGIVIERTRPAESMDRLRWHCQQCREVVHETAFHCDDIQVVLRQAINRWTDTIDLRTCARCGHVNPPKY